MFEHWPRAVHPDLQKLDDDAQKILEGVLSSAGDASRLKKLKSSVIALLTASWWPYTSFDALRVATIMSIWLFIWDDETDSYEYSQLINDYDRSCVYRDETIRYIRGGLSLDSPKIDLGSISNDRTITMFKPVGEAIAKSCTQRQIQRFFDELLLFVQMTEEEHLSQTKHIIPTVEEYLERRMGSSAVGVCLAIHEYALGIELPKEVMDDRAMKALWHETNIIISTVNDCLSIKKEVILQAQSQVDTLIPLLCPKLGSAQAAADVALEMIRSATSQFQAAEAEILQRYSHIPHIHDDLQRFVDSCKYACTANLDWR
ncbi:Uu.00g115330.m01.CDS01 [Anthostomella pinea]|uniref:Terpene synthase n=1 Tax=Anthostomella pinea TaxID=933095 RepID=A0AAI8YGQ5_9PEZI|nr:Uu.00g115330.m01.CDS01 [Anthostomella pinea]